MTWQIKFSDRAAKSLESLDKTTQIRILKFLMNRVVPSGNPRLFGKALTGKLSGYWSYRVGDYRLVADFQDENLIILVLNVGHRREVYED